MMCRVVPDSWMPLRCMTNVIGALWTAAAFKPFSACPEIQPASPVWQMTCAALPWCAFSPSASPVPTGNITPRRPELSSVPPGTHET